MEIPIENIFKILILLIICENNLFLFDPFQERRCDSLWIWAGDWSPGGKLRWLRMDGKQHEKGIFWCAFYAIALILVMSLQCLQYYILCSNIPTA